VNFTQAKLGLADFSGTELSAIVFSMADLSGANFSGAKLDQVDCTGAKLQHVNAADCQYKHTVFKEANITQAIFAKSRFRFCDLSMAQLDDSDFSETQFNACHLYGLSEQKTLWLGATLVNSPKEDALRTHADLWQMPR